MSFNGYKNYQTWLFMLHYEDYIYELIKEQQEYNDEEITYSTVYETVENIIDELDESIDRIEYGAFIKDLISAELNEIDKKEIAETILEMLKDD